MFYSPSGHHWRGWRGSWLFLQRKECLNFVLLPFLMLINEIFYFPIVEKLPDTLVLLKLKTFSNHGLSPVAKLPKRPTFTQVRTVTAKPTGQSGRWVEGNYISRHASHVSTMEPCRHPGHGAARSVRAAGFRPGCRPGRRALLGRENCNSRHALPRMRLRTGATAPERVDLKRCVSSMETGLPAAEQSYWRTDELWGEPTGRGGGPGPAGESRRLSQDHRPFFLLPSHSLGRV